MQAELMMSIQSRLDIRCLLFSWPILSLCVLIFLGLFNFESFYVTSAIGILCLFVIIDPQVNKEYDFWVRFLIVLITAGLVLFIARHMLDALPAEARTSFLSAIPL